MTEEPDWKMLVPEVTLRPQQLDALHRVWSALYLNDKSICILEAPTGVGKSIVQVAISRYVDQCLSGRSHMTTPQRALQDQMQGWTGVKIMKGKRSYRCNVVDEATADIAPCTDDPSIRERDPVCATGQCPYFTALDEAQRAPLAVHNYASLMAQSHIGRHFDRRDLLCLDEGHTAVQWIRNYMTVEFTPSELRGLTSESPPSTDRLQYFLPWLRWMIMQVDSIPAGLPDNLKVTLMRMLSHRSAYGLTKFDELNQQWISTVDPSVHDDRSFERFAKKHFMDSGTVPWATLWNPQDYWHPEGFWSCVPLRVAPMASSLLGLGQKVLIVTATALNKSLFCVELGIDRDDAEYIALESAFSPTNRPIRRRYVGKMTYNEQRATVPKMLKELVDIANEHHAEPGMIHTVSHRLAKQIKDGLDSMIEGRTVLLPDGSKRDAVIQRFLSGALGSNAILIGPSLMEGIDGAGDSCRWQAMCKVPWPHMKDPVVTRLMESVDPTTKKWANAWYTWKAAQQTVQGMGRVCRSDDDYGVTYLLDSGFKRMLDSGFVPRYVLDAVV